MFCMGETKDKGRQVAQRHESYDKSRRQMGVEGLCPYL